MIAATRLRGGSAASSRGAASFAAEAVRTARATGCSGIVVVRAGSAFYSAALARAVRAAGAFFSVTVPMNPHVAAAIAATSEDAWRPIRYPPDRRQQRPDQPGPGHGTLTAPAATEPRPSPPIPDKPQYR